jgi:hypothetical protein
MHKGETKICSPKKRENPPREIRGYIQKKKKKSEGKDEKYAQYFFFDCDYGGHKPA